MGDHPFRVVVARCVGVIGAFALLAVPAFSRPSQQQNRQNSQRKVWTNEDVASLKEKDAISIVGLGPDDFQVPEPAPQQGAAKKVWTNEDLEKLRNQGDISIIPAVEQAPPQPAAPAAAPPPAATAPGRSGPAEAEANPHYDRFRDPYWYEKKAYELHQELDVREFRLYRYEEGIELAKDRITQPGIDIFGGDIGITPEAGVENLLTAIGDVEIRLDDLRNLARHNGIPPGVLRD